MLDHLAYFRQAVSNPASVPPWSEWWAENIAELEKVVSIVDYVRLKHRRLLGARQILQLAGELPRDFVPPSLVETGSCSVCGERTGPVTVAEGDSVRCPLCGATEG